MQTGPDWACGVVRQAKKVSPLVDQAGADIKMNALDRSGNRNTRDSFYLGMSIFSLVIALVGFSRSFYLQDYFSLPELPVRLIVHGTVLTAWFFLACLQPALVWNRKTPLHRQTGIAALFIAVAVIVAGVWTVVMRDAPNIDEYPTRAAGNLASLFMFLFCVALGVYFRRQSGHHKRLMMMASIPVLAPALDRFARIPPLNDLFGKLLYWFPAPAEIAFATIAFLALLVLVVIHDLVHERRVHPGTVWGLVAIFIFSPAATAMIVATGGWLAFVKWVA